MHGSHGPVYVFQPRSLGSPVRAARRLTRQSSMLRCQRWSDLLNCPSTLASDFAVSPYHHGRLVRQMIAGKPKWLICHFSKTAPLDHAKRFKRFQERHAPFSAKLQRIHQETSKTTALDSLTRKLQSEVCTWTSCCGPGKEEWFVE